MSIKTILAAASGGTASEGTLELACRLAQRLDAHLEAYHVGTDPRELFAVIGAAGFGTVAPFSDHVIDKIVADAAELATKTHQSFQAAIARHHLPLATSPSKATASAAWRTETGNAAFLVAQRARFFDLVILGCSDRALSQPCSDTIEQALLGSGRPILLAPASAPAAVGEAVALGWNGSAQAVRALATGLSLLAAARTVTVITVGNKEADVASVIDYLAWHGIAASHHNSPSIPGVGPGQQLFAAARAKGADLLVVGGYGHTPWREFLFGGATAELLKESTLPILLSH
jgi:nucleotide-binding universal stress UspA family protein